MVDGVQRCNMKRRSCSREGYVQHLVCHSSRTAFVDRSVRTACRSKALCTGRKAGLSQPHSSSESIPRLKRHRRCTSFGIESLVIHRRHSTHPRAVINTSNCGQPKERNDSCFFVQKIQIVLCKICFTDRQTLCKDPAAFIANSSKPPLPPPRTPARRHLRIRSPAFSVRRT